MLKQYKWHIIICALVLAVILYIFLPRQLRFDSNAYGDLLEIHHQGTMVTIDGNEKLEFTQIASCSAYNLSKKRSGGGPGYEKVTFLYSSSHEQYAILVFPFGDSVYDLPPYATVRNGNNNYYKLLNSDDWVEFADKMLKLHDLLCNKSK